MKRNGFRRVLSLILSLAIVLSLLSAMTVFAATGTVSHNTATRHQVCTALSDQAEAYYTGSYTYSRLSALSGVSSPTDSWATTQNNPLYTALQTLMTDTHTVYSRYNPSGEQSDELSYLWDYTDSVGSASQYQYFYTDISADSYGTGDMQREHVWPKSNASYYETNGGADLHHLRPSIGGVNSAKSNNTFGNIASTGSAYQVNGVDVIWTGSSMLEVQDNIKGDVARILLYVYCRWGQPNLYTDVSASKLPTMDSDDSTNNGTRAIDGLETLLQWMEIDPVDQWEMARNDQTENFQGNRNVFIDYPEFAWLIFNEDVPANYTTPSGNGGSGSGTTSYTITASVNNSAYGSATVSGNTIIASPSTGYEVSGYTLLSGTATVTRDGNVFTVEASSNCAIRINFKARTAYSVSFSVPDGVSQSSLSCYEGESITLPTPTGTPTADAQDYKFSGWVTAPVDNSSDRPTVLTAGSSYTPTASTTLYALYTYVTGSNGTVAYHLVTDASQLVSGASVIIAAADYDYALSTTQRTNNRGQAQVTKNTTDNTLAFATDAGVAELTLSEGNLSDTYAFYDSTALGYLHAASSSSNYLRTESTLSDNSSFSIVVNSDGSCTLTAQGSYTRNILRYNASSKIFSCYASTSTSMQATALYIASAGGETFYTTVLGEACNHRYNSVVTAPTCTEGGFTTHTCTLCGYIYVDSTTAALGHNYDSGTVTTAATCEAPGVLTYACQNEGCNSAYTETIPATGHNYVGGICANCGDVQGTANSYTLVTSGTPISGDTILVVKAGGSNSGNYTYYAMQRVTDSTYLLAVGADDFMGTGAAPSSINVADDTLVWSLAVSDATISLSDGGSNVLYHTDNNLYYTTGTATDWTFAFDSTTGTFKLSHSARYLGLRDDLSSTGSNGNPRFRCNGSATTTSYQFYIYQSVAADHSHSTTAVPAKAPTCTEGGNLAYWYCADCGKYFSDAACTVETTLAALTLEATGHSYVNGVCSVCGASNEIYELTTSLSEGDRVVIVNVSYNKALSTTYSGYYNAGVDVAPSNNQLLNPPEEIIWTVGIDANGNYTFSTATGSKLSMDTSFTSTPLDMANDTWTLTAAPTTADAFYIGNAGRSGYYLEWYSSRNYWSAYNNTSNEALFAVQFYAPVIEEHVHSYSGTIVPPTCTEGGYMLYTCSCGDSFKEGETNPTGHVNTTTTTVNATCTEAGSVTVTCNDCGITVSTQTIAATGHQNRSTRTTNPTCTETGSIVTYCVDCGVTLQTQVLAATNHQNRATTTKNPTCTEAGYERVKCNDCGEILSETTIAATGHEYNYTNNGSNHIVGCDNGCGYSATEGHTYENGSCICGAVETVEPAEPTEVTIKIGHTVSFDSDLKMNYRIKKSNIETVVPNYVAEGAYLVVEKDRYPMGGGAKTVETVTLYPDLTTDPDRLLFNLSGIQSVEMGSELRAVLHFFDTEGNEYYTQVDAYSVLAYAELCFDSYDPATNGYLFTMLIDCMNYGAAAQVNFDRRADELVNAGLDAYQQYATTELSAELTDVRTYVDNDRSITAVTKMGFNVTFADKTEINAKLTIADGYTKSDITSVKVLNEAGEVVDTLTEFTELDDGRLQVTFTGVKSANMRDMFYFVAYVGDQIASQNVGYSIEAYAKSNIASTDAALATLVRNCIYYGDSAKAYFDSLLG